MKTYLDKLYEDVKAILIWQAAKATTTKETNDVICKIGEQIERCYNILKEDETEEAAE